MDLLLIGMLVGHAHNSFNGARVQVRLAAGNSRVLSPSLGKRVSTKSPSDHLRPLGRRGAAVIDSGAGMALLIAAASRLSLNISRSFLNTCSALLLLITSKNI